MSGDLNDGVLNAQTESHFLGVQLRRLPELVEAYCKPDMEMAWAPLRSNPMEVVRCRK